MSDWIGILVKPWSVDLIDELTGGVNFKEPSSESKTMFLYQLTTGKFTFLDYDTIEDEYEQTGMIDIRTYSKR